MKTPTLSAIAIGVLLSIGVWTTVARAQLMFPTARLFTVNDTADSTDADLGDEVCRDSNGKCTLRAAIQQANNCCGTNVIDFALPWGSVIDLTLGELLVTKTVHLVGPGARRLTIQRSTVQGTPNFRIFHIGANAGIGMIIRGFTVKNGNTDGDGGGFLIGNGNLIRMTEIALRDNAAERGGGIANAGTLRVFRSLFSGNTALSFNGAGGAFMNLAGPADAIISNSTITANSAISGGGINNSGSLLLVNNTIDRNSGTTVGRNIVSAASGTVSVLNTIVSSDNSSAIASLSGVFSSIGSNLITDGRNSTGFANGVSGDQVSFDNSINPLLGALADNGGQTDTLALGAGSPAIDRGNNCVTTANCPSPVPPVLRLPSDQRSYRRLVGGTVDIGAFESQSGASASNLGLFYFGNNPRLAGSLIILTNAGTNQKRYRITHVLGGFSLSNLSTIETYILEIRSKRAGLSSVAVFEFEEIAARNAVIIGN